MPARATADIKKSEASVASAKLFEAEANLKLATAEALDQTAARLARPRRL